MSTSRQDPNYSSDDSTRGAVAILTAYCTPDGFDQELVDDALELALDRTDHTALVHNLGLILALTVQMAAEGRGQSRAALVQQIAATVSQSMEDDPE